jgi:tRNA A37 threonylcarbamoyladenosine biosynthesis protein TsaE
MWLKSMSLQNIKCFKDVELIFSKEQNMRSEAKPHHWITLLGENGVGKSSLLQCIALLLAGPEAAKELLPRPAGWIRDPSTPGKLTAHICQETDDQGSYGSGNEKWKRKNFSYSYYITGDTEVKVPLRGRKRQKQETYTEPVLIEESTNIVSWLRLNAFASGNQGWFAVGYGSFRRLTRVSQILIPHLETLTRASNFITQFNEDSPLSSFERWMVYLDYRQVKDSQDKQAQKMRSIGEKAVTSLLPKDVKIAEVTKDGLINFEVNGQTVPTIGLSDGFRSVIALAGDLIWRLLQAFPNMEDPTKASGIVLIDELDIHLHPIWQRDIADWLREIFPNLQFIVATHSPLVAIGAGPDALTVRFEMDEKTGEVKVEYIKDIFTYDVDQALRSPAFNLVSTYSPKIEKQIKQYHQLRLQLEKYNNLTAADTRLLDELTVLMRKINPANEPPEPGSLMERVNRFLEEKLPA